jgi:putative DNA primase/helicase
VTALLHRLADFGIHLRRCHPGENRAACPECARTKIRRGDDALAVRVEHDRIVWLCHRCSWTGAIIHHEDRMRARPVRPAQRYDRLAPWGRDLWHQCQPVEPGTVAAAYLERRGCILPPVEGDLRWRPSLLDKATGYTGPALVALVTDTLTSAPISLHRTWIAPDGSGKAPIAKPRRLLKDHRSDGVVRLWPDDSVTLGLAIGEGIETCLAAARKGLTPVWAALSAGNLAAFPVLPGIEGLHILADNDEAGLGATMELGRRYVGAGMSPKNIIVIRSTTPGFDLADELQQGVGR